MKLSKITLTIAALVFATMSYAQSSVQSKVEARKVSSQSKVDSKSITNNDGYMNQSREILSRLKVKEIPASFPKYKEGQTREEYKEVMMEWAKANKEMLNPEFKRKLEAKESNTK